MVTHLWFFYALGAASLWGIAYVIAEKVMNEGITPAYLIFFSTLITLPFYLGVAWVLGQVKDGWDLTFNPENRSLLWLIICSSFAGIGGNFLILLSVNNKNATMASLVEISYPLFTLLFAWLILKEVQINWAGALGAVLIFSGIAVIYLKG